MSADFLLYGSNGFVGDYIARQVAQNGLRPILAGRNESKIKEQSNELGVPYRVFSLEDPDAIDSALDEVDAVLHCAGPYLYTFKPMVDACLRMGKHYLDITGELPVYEAIASKDEQAKAKDVMLMPGVGFDVVPTDCLAAHLKGRLPSATQLTIAYQSQGPAGLPPGTMNTMVEMIPYNTNLRRKNGSIEPGPQKRKNRMIDFGQGEVEATMLTWGDVFMAYHSTGIPNIEDYAVLPNELVQVMSVTDRMRSLFKYPFIRNLAKRGMKGGSTSDERSKTRMHVWGEVVDSQGIKAVSRLHGPEAGVIWTARAALAAMQKVKEKDTKPGFQTPSSAFGPDFVLESEGVVREDIP